MWLMAMRALKIRSIAYEIPSRVAASRSEKSRSLAAEESKDESERISFSPEKSQKGLRP
jgi:ribosomal 50S subunit-recycling heat shock protein